MIQVRNNYPSEPTPELDALIKAARKLPPMTPAERREQAISFVYGNLPEESQTTREQIAAAYDEMYGGEDAKAKG